ncbi:type IV toxin-antitoxin system AbiEi family antitoxin domain-containing protein [Nocardioides sp. WS12]|uniref:type IV toxin-antitoxin system AbiEi family antitoxin domain-containing protein n=1 Tax=Nocardioides sp. WS12 TaxID=2486272 RepID=UPI0015F81876|nr:type IV toxin-antitoxin system AbiEi family antitoxin domain-containing protein [Nocardioides sp. WS12]
MTALESFDGRPFTASMARDAGIDRNRLHLLVKSGRARRVVYGVYVAASTPDSLDLRAHAAGLALPAHAVVADRCAAWLHDVDILDFEEHDVIPELDAVSRGGKGRSTRKGVFGGKRDLAGSEVMTLPGGVRVTTPLRTACDVACLFGRYRAIATLDEFRRKHRISQLDLALMLPRFRGRRGVIQLRELIPLSTDRADSQAESWVRLMIHDEGLPMPEAQVDVVVPGWGAARMENAYPHLRIAVEYDGEKDHTSERDRDRDETRRAALEAAGWIIFVVRKGDLKAARRAIWLAQLAQAITERSPGRPSKRIYSRGPDQPSYRWRRRQD